MSRTELDDAIDFARGAQQSVLATIRSNGRPQLSNVLHHVFEDGIIRISITADPTTRPSRSSLRTIGR